MDLSARVGALLSLSAAALLLGPLLLTRFFRLPSPRRRQGATVEVPSLPELPASVPRLEGAAALEQRRSEVRSRIDVQADRAAWTGSRERPLFIADRQGKRSGRSRCLAPFRPAVEAVWEVHTPHELAIVARQQVNLTSALALVANRLSLELPGSVLRASSELDRWALEYADPD
jgi:hypothetical protein